MNIFLSISGAFKTFEIPYLMTRGGPGDSTNLIAYNIYKEAYLSNHAGYASAKAVVLCVIVNVHCNFSDSSYEEEGGRSMIDSECSKFSVGKFAATIVLVIVCLVMLTPIIFAVINSFKPYAEMMTSFVSFPNSLDLNNYVKAWKVANYQKSFFVSLVITVFGTIGAVLLASMASYKLARPNKIEQLYFYGVCFIYDYSISCNNDSSSPIGKQTTYN